MPTWSRPAGNPLLATLRAGFAAAVRRAPLVVVLWQVNLLFGAILAGLAATALVVTLDASWYTRSLLYDLDPTALFALLIHHSATFRLLGAAALTLIVLHLAIWLLLHGAVVASVCGDDDLGVRDSLRAGAGVLPVYLRIFALAAIVFALAVGGSVVGALAGMRWARQAASPGIWEVCALAGFLVGGTAWVFCGAVHDHARIRCFARGDGALSSYVWALSFVWRGGKHAFPLALVLLAAGLLLGGFYQVVASQISADWMTGVVLSILWGQAMLLTRSLLRVWSFAAEARLQDETADQRSLPQISPLSDE